MILLPPGYVPDQVFHLTGTELTDSPLLCSTCKAFSVFKDGVFHTDSGKKAH